MNHRLYKYASASERSLAILQTNQIYFCPPVDFNDPFECQLPTDVYEQLKLSPAEDLANVTRAYLMQEQQGKFDALFIYIRETNPDLINDSDYIIYKAYEYKILRQSYSGSENNFKKIFFENTGILCVTTENDSILMWSHYACNHKGICIEFDAGKLAQMGEVYDVNYVPAFEEVYDINGSMVMKQDCWSYEKEKRVIKYAWVTEGKAENPGCHLMPENTITGLIFGCKTPYETIHEYTGIALKHHPDIRIYMAERVPAKFKLELKEYNLSNYPRLI
ncbi:MAG: hypothetical protein JWR09_1750 [Mucilaginibacter sp.]|nr:hypothetical protein [Mucilaginibacter sp.]